MATILMLAAGAAAVASLVMAQSAALATVPLAGTVKLGETTWGAMGRLWAAAGLVVLAAIMHLCSLRRFWPGVCSGCALGVLIDVGLSGWQWRAEKIALLNSIGIGRLAEQIKWGPAANALIASGVFLLAFILIGSYCVRSSHKD